jgi:hypothetical protein
MSGLKEKLGIKVAVTLLFSVFVLAGLTVTQAYGQPLDSPLYSNTNAKVVESMNATAEANLVAIKNANNSDTDDSGGTWYPKCSTRIACPDEVVPVASPLGEIVFILTLTGGACWAIIRKKRS